MKKKNTKIKAVQLSKDKKSVIGEINRLSTNSYRWMACGDMPIGDYITDRTLPTFATGKASTQNAAFVAIRRAHVVRQAELQNAIKNNVDVYTKACLEMTDEDHEAEARREEDLKAAGVNVHG